MSNSQVSRIAHAPPPGVSKQQPHWVSVSPHRSHQYMKEFFFVCALLFVGCVAVAYRVYVCQLQAYAMLILVIFVAVLNLRYRSLRQECTVEASRTQLYCLDLGTESSISLVVGRHARLMKSNYERLHHMPTRMWLMLALWLSWIAYGSLFHSGEHAAAENDLLVDLAHVGASTPQTLRVLRVYVLAFNAIVSLLLSPPLFVSFDEHYRHRPVVQDASEEDDPNESVSNALPTSRTSIYYRLVAFVYSLISGHPLHFATIFFVLLFFPVAESTPQALLPTQLFARTSLFAALFFISEVFERTKHFVDWLAAYRPETAGVLVGVQMALGNVQRKALPVKGRAAISGAIGVGHTNILSDSNGRTFSLSRELSNWSIIVRSAWILVASSSVIWCALVQLLITLVLIYRMRASVYGIVQQRANLLRLKSTQHERTPVFLPQQQQQPILPVTMKNGLENAQLIENDTNEEEEQQIVESDNEQPPQQQHDEEQCNQIESLPVPTTTSLEDGIPLMVVPKLVRKQPSPPRSPPVQQHDNARGSRSNSPTKLPPQTTLPPTIQAIVAEQNDPLPTSTTAAKNRARRLAVLHVTNDQQ